MDNDHSSCQSLETFFTSTPVIELALPYMANTEECRSLFYVNVTIKTTPHEPPHYLLRVQTDNDAAESSSSWMNAGQGWLNGCDPNGCHYDGELSKCRFKCNCDRFCTVHVRLNSELASSAISVCEVVLHW